VDTSINFIISIRMLLFSSIMDWIDGSIFSYFVLITLSLSLPLIDHCSFVLLWDSALPGIIFDYVLQHLEKNQRDQQSTLGMWLRNLFIYNSHKYNSSERQSEGEKEETTSKWNIPLILFNRVVDVVFSSMLSRQSQSAECLYNIQTNVI